MDNFSVPLNGEWCIIKCNANIKGTKILLVASLVFLFGIGLVYFFTLPKQQEVSQQVNKHQLTAEERKAIEEALSQPAPTLTVEQKLKTE